jgi:hypothetical protein
MLNLLGGGPKPDPEALARIKGWTREAFALADDAVVMVTELRCQEDDCPDVETVIAVMTGPGLTRRFKLMKPAGEVTPEEVAALPATGGSH